MKKVNLLILDDKEENIVSLHALLSEIQDINIICSMDPNEALKICWKNNVSIALVDVQMPEINGFEFVSLLKANPITSHIMAVMVTAISKEEKFLIKGLQSGAVDYLYKPLNPDITIAKVNSFIQQIHIQEEVKLKNQQLEQNRKALIQAHKEAEDARKSKELFLANMSHEIRTPINGIIGIVHMLMSSNLSLEHKDWINRLSTASNSLLLIINDILDISKIDSGKLRVEFEEFNLNKLLTEIGMTYRGKALEKNINFEIKIGENIPKYIKFDALRLQQIITNFVSNSLKFTEKGTITLSAICQDTIDNRSHIKFSVRDTGIGIKPDAVDKIFLAFEQADDGITRKFGGTGLGLAIVKRLATLLKGVVYAESAYGQGSEFFFEVEVEKVQKLQDISNQDNLLYNQFSKLHLKILIAEDNDLNSYMLSHILQAWGCEVVIVRNGRLALDSLQSQSFDLVLMDTHMPVMSGFEAIHQIRSNNNPKLSKLPVITISASVMPHEQEAAFEVGADEVIVKPFNPNELYSKIVKLYQRSLDKK